MLNRRTSPGLAEWVFVTFLVGGFIFMAFKLYQYGSVRKLFPVGLEVAGINVAGFTRDEAEAVLTEIYLTSPVTLYHGDKPIDIFPSNAEFTLDFEAMMEEAITARDEQDYWAGFWGYLWGRPIDIATVELQANHNDLALRATLKLAADQFDTPIQPSKPDPNTMTFLLGSPGLETDVEGSIDPVVQAFYTPDKRSANLALKRVDAQTPGINLLSTLLVNTLQEFEADTGGIGSVYIMDMTSGSEIGYNTQVPMSGMSILRLPILVEAYRQLGPELTADQEALARGAAVEITNTAANDLLKFIARSDDPQDGVALVTESMQRLGLRNTFLGCAYDVEEAQCVRYETDANRLETDAIDPNPYQQTTAEDIGLLLSMIYDCAERGGGTLLAVYSADFTPQKCSQIIELMRLNRIGSLIEEGVPSSISVAHRHGWQQDTNGDAAIIHSPGGNYIIVEFTHKPGVLDWGTSSALMSDLSRAAYNYFNIDSPYLAQR